MVSELLTELFQVWSAASGQRAQSFTLNKNNRAEKKTDFNICDEIHKKKKKPYLIIHFLPFIIFIYIIHSH